MENINAEYMHNELINLAICTIYMHQWRFLRTNHLFSVFVNEMKLYKNSATLLKQQQQ